MLRVTIELVPFGDETEKKTLGQIDIINDGSGDLDVGNYVATLSDEPIYTKDGKAKEWKNITLKGFHRRAFGPYHLLLEVLKKAISR